MLWLWDQVGTRLIVYIATLPFFLILAGGSLSYFAAISSSSETRLRTFLDDLHFPFSTLVLVYYGAPQTKVISIILDASPRPSMMTRIFGSIFPICYVLVAIFNLVAYRHSNSEMVVSIAFIGLFVGTFLSTWQFGHRLKLTRLFTS